MKRLVLSRGFFLLAGALLGAVSCTNDVLTEESVTIGVPPPHPALLLATPGAAPSWTARWYDADGSVVTKEGVTGDFSIVLERGSFTPVILEPDTASAGIPRSCLPVAGAVYPEDCQYPEKARPAANVHIEASWEGGVSALTAETVLENATRGFAAGRTIAAHFNWERFSSTVAELGYPQRLDRERIASAILEGDVTKRDIREKASVTASWPAESAASPVSGTTFRDEWPSHDSFPWPVAGEKSLVLGEGVNRFFGEAGFVTISVADGRIVGAVFERYRLQD